MQITPDHVADLAALRLSAYDAELTVLPGLGGKISSMRLDGAEYLAQNPRKGLRAARYAAPFSEYDASGFDECFPTVAPCRYPEFPWEGIEVPDHGELWSIPWSAQKEDGQLHLSTHGVRFPYEFHKWIGLPAPGHIQLRYSLTNHAPLPLRYLWSSHPIFAPVAGMRLYLPSDVKVLVEWSKGGRLGGQGTMLPWPHTRDRAGQPVDLSLIGPDQTGLGEKLFTTRLTEGWCAAHDPASQRYVAMFFSPDEIPYVGLFTNTGGWPEDEPGYYNLGLEPCRGFPDSLAQAVERGAYSTAQAGATDEWHVDVRLGRTDDMSAEIARLREM
jgi:hypothetical protein